MIFFKVLVLFSTKSIAYLFSYSNEKVTDDCINTVAKVRLLFFSQYKVT